MHGLVVPSVGRLKDAVRSRGPGGADGAGVKGLPADAATVWRRGSPLSPLALRHPHTQTYTNPPHTHTHTHAVPAPVLSAGGERGGGARCVAHCAVLHARREGDARLPLHLRRRVKERSDLNHKRTRRRPSLWHVAFNSHTCARVSAPSEVWPAAPLRRTDGMTDG